MKSILSIAFGLLITITSVGQVYEYTEMTFHRNDFRTGDEIHSSISVEGVLIIDLESEIASFRYHDLFTGEIRESRLFIVSSESDPVITKLVCVSGDFLKYRVTINLKTATVTFSSVKWMATMEGQPNIYPNASSFEFSINKITAHGPKSQPQEENH